MEILLISGKSGSGKDTLANLMREKLESSGCKCLTIHFADLVKEYLKMYYNWNGIKDERGRTLLQSLGTDKVRTQDTNYWAECVARFLAAISPYNDFDCAFIPDARFENEVEIVKKYNPQTVTIRIERFNENGTHYQNPSLTVGQINHPSETSLDDYEDFDYFVENRSLKELQESAEFLLKITNLLN